jgi:hypothetical protein
MDIQFNNGLGKGSLCSAVAEPRLGGQARFLVRDLHLVEAEQFAKQGRSAGTSLTLN